MNHLSGVNRLANRYHAMRHGQSRANVAGVIVSGIENDRRGDWGLSELGREQVLAGGSGLRPARGHADLLVGLLPRQADRGDRARAARRPAGCRRRGAARAVFR